MRVFEPIYKATIDFSKHKAAPWYLATLSFFESFILPFPPPDVMLAPMVLARPNKALFLATLTLVASVCGGVIGYLVGTFLFEPLQPFLITEDNQLAFDTVTEWMIDWGFWAVLIAGFSPIPYKLFTVSAGLLGLAFIPFLIASLIGRGARFFLVALCLAKFGAAIERKLIGFIEIIGWAIVVILIVVITLYYW